MVTHAELRRIRLDHKPGDMPLAQNIFGQAVSFHEAGIRCGTPVVTENGSRVTADSPMVVCYGFAAELYLKCLHVIESGRHGRGHKLTTLMGRLSPEMRDEVSARWSDAVTLGGGSLGVALAACSEAFEEWRYVFEVENRQIPAGDLVALAQALYFTVRAREPGWAVGEYLHSRLSERPTKHIFALMTGGGITSTAEIENADFGRDWTS